MDLQRWTYFFFAEKIYKCRIQEMVGGRRYERQRELRSKAPVGQPIFPWWYVSRQWIEILEPFGEKLALTRWGRKSALCKRRIRNPNGSPALYPKLIEGDLPAVPERLPHKLFIRIAEARMVEIHPPGQEPE